MGEMHSGKVSQSRHIRQRVRTAAQEHLKLRSLQSGSMSALPSCATRLFDASVLPAKELGKKVHQKKDDDGEEKAENIRSVTQLLTSAPGKEATLVNQCQHISLLLVEGRQCLFTFILLLTKCALQSSTDGQFTLTIDLSTLVCSSLCLTDTARSVLHSKQDDCL